MKKQRRWISMLILSIFLLGVTAMPGVAGEEAAGGAEVATGAAEAAQAVTAEPAVSELTLEQATQLALENNTSIQLAEVQRKLKSIALTQARQEQRAYEDTGNLAYSTYPGFMAREVTPKTAALEEEWAEKVKASAINGIMVGVEGSYYNLLKAQENVNISSRSLERAEEQLRQANVRLQAGTASKIEVMQAEAAVAGAEVGLLAAENALGQSRRALNQMLGQDIATEIKAIDAIAFEPQEYVLDELLAQALAEDTTYMKARVELESAQMSDDLMSSYYGGGTWNGRQVKQALIAAQLAEQDAKAALLNNVYTSYETYGMLTEQHTALNKVLELTKEAYRLQQLTYEVGLSTFEDVNKSEDDLRQAEANLAECVYNYNVLKSAFKYNVYKSQ